jgi:hypothetical protein
MRVATTAESDLPAVNAAQQVGQTLTETSFVTYLASLLKKFPHYGCPSLCV